jgi:glycerate kinase
MPKLFLAALSLGDAFDASDAASALERSIRLTNRELMPADVVCLPIVDGGPGTLEFLVNHTLGSYIEVEATDAEGDQEVVPFGLCGSDEKLAVIEMERVSGVDAPGTPGTTYGVGELIRDVLDEGAFSVLLGLSEPLARDAGLGLAAALGVKFYDENDSLLDLSKPGVEMTAIQRIDASDRAFELLAARFFVARAKSVPLLGAEDKEYLSELRRLATILKRDVGIELPVDSLSLSTSGIEFGLIAFLSAAIRDGGDLVLEAADVCQRFGESLDEALIVLARDVAQLSFVTATETLLSAAEPKLLPIVLVLANPVTDESRRALRSRFPRCSIFSLADAKVFQAPLAANARTEDLRRDLLIRLDKLMPQVLAELTRARAVA